MTKAITITIPHALGLAEAQRRLQQGFADLERQFAGGLGIVSIQQRWIGNRLEFEGGAVGQKIHGFIDVLDNNVNIQVDLPQFLALIAERIKSRLQREAQLLLEKKE